MFCTCRSLAAADHKTTMWDAFVVSIQFFLGYECYSCLIANEVVRHCFNFIFNASCVSAFFQYYIAFTKVRRSSCHFWCFTIADSRDDFLFRHCVLASICYAFDTTDRVGMTLGYATAPERVGIALW